MSVEEVDVCRHREITSKAVSAILLLLLKWFKVSRECPGIRGADLRVFAHAVFKYEDILKFQHLSTLLIDSNCLLLVLKMFGLQELLVLIQSKHEKEDSK
jgi:hypothetical protein